MQIKKKTTYHGFANMYPSNIKLRNKDNIYMHLPKTYVISSLAKNSNYMINLQLNILYSVFREVMRFCQV